MAEYFFFVLWWRYLGILGSFFKKTNIRFLTNKYWLTLSQDLHLTININLVDLEKLDTQRWPLYMNYWCMFRYWIELQLWVSLSTSIYSWEINLECCNWVVLEQLKLWRVSEPFDLMRCVSFRLGKMTIKEELLLCFVLTFKEIQTAGEETSSQKATQRPSHSKPAGPAKFILDPKKYILYN